MAIRNLFSKRQKVLRKEVPDVYCYDVIPHQLRVQIVYILRDLFGDYSDGYDSSGCLRSFKLISDPLCREYGLFRLSPPNLMHGDHRVDLQVTEFLLQHADHEQVMDTIEISLQVAIFRTQSNDFGTTISTDRVKRAMEELNARFREHGIGYQYESGEMIRVDSKLIHAEVVKPALALLSAAEYKGANEEFLKAFEDYRKGDTKGCLNECLKAFESTMKAICKKRNWAFRQMDTAKTLIGICFENELIPTMMEAHFASMRATLESGVPTIRNKLSAHGQGASVTTVPMHYAGYMLHLTATTIQFLVESEKAMK